MLSLIKAGEDDHSTLAIGGADEAGYPTEVLILETSVGVEGGIYRSLIAGHATLQADRKGPHPVIVIVRNHGNHPVCIFSWSKTLWKVLLCGRPNVLEYCIDHSH